MKYGRKGELFMDISPAPTFLHAKEIKNTRHSSPMALKTLSHNKIPR